MTNLTPSSSLDNVIQLETTDLVLAGPGGPLNQQAQSLLNRTQFLNDQRVALGNTADPAKGTALVGRSAQVVNSVAELRLLKSASASVHAFTTGYYAAGDGGHGQYRLDPSDVTTPDDGVSTFVNVTDGGRWKLMHNGIINIRQAGCHPSLANNAVRWQAACDYAFSIAGELYSPPGIYTFTTSITKKNGVRYRGAGVDISLGGTKYVFTGTTDFAKISNPLNSSTSANIELDGIWFSSTTQTANSGLLFDTGSSVVLVKRCRFNYSGCGIILDQSELFDIDNNSFNGTSSGSCGIWFVNGPDKNAGSSPFFTNRIGARANDFNGAAGSVAIYDDGGTAHTFENNNLNACGSHIIATSVNGLKITGGEYEVSSAQSIILGLTKRLGGAGAKSPSVSICDTFLYNDISQPVIAAVTGAVGQLRLQNNFINTPSTPFIGLAAACDSIEASGNVQVGAGGSVGINNHIDSTPAATAWNAVTTSPSLGNGALVASYTRKGRAITMRLRLTTGSTTTYGSGAWTFQLPIAADVNAFAQVGACRLFINGTSIYTATSQVDSTGTLVNIYTTAGVTVQAGTPAAWTANSTVEFQITYVAAQPI